VLDHARAPNRALSAFLADHRSCGELDGGRDGATLWLECVCGVRTVRPVGVPTRLYIEASYAGERYPA